MSPAVICASDFSGTMHLRPCQEIAHGAFIGQARVGPVVQFAVKKIVSCGGRRTSGRHHKSRKRSARGSLIKCIFLSRDQIHLKHECLIPTIVSPWAK
jgi:hypothetical protein